jgi:hypothetical protein
MKSFTKGEMKSMILSESSVYKIFEKKNLRLKESEKNAYVTPSNNGINSLSSDLSKSKSENPTDDNFVVDMNQYDNKSSNDNITLDISGKNPQDASRNIQTVMKNPHVKQLLNTSNVNANVHINNESIERLRESSVPFTKKELNNLLNL